MEWMILPLKRYAEFSGRSRRKEYWLFFLFTVICSVVLGVLDSALGLTFGGTGTSNAFRDNGVLGSIFSLATLVPSIAVGVRRLHDTDRTGWWILAPVAAAIAGGIVGAVLGSALGSPFGWAAGLAGLGVVVTGIALLVFYCTDGTSGPNRFGSDPKDPVGDVAEVFR